MSTISALKVFALFGKKASRDTVETSVTSSSVLTMGDIPATQPPWLQQILDGHQKELEASKQTNENFMRKFDEYATALRTDFATLDTKQQETSQKLQEVHTEVETLKTEVQIHHTDISTVDQRVDDTKAELLAKIEDLRQEFQAKLDGKVAPHPDRPVVPATASIGDQSRIEHEFSALLIKARNMTNCFAMGRVTGIVGVASIPKSSEKVLADYFAGISIAMTPSLGKSQVKRFSVGKEDLPNFQANLELYDPQIRADGWWIAVDLPPELRALRSNAFQFFKETKALYSDIRATYLDVSHDSGFVTVDGIDFIPVYMVPRDKKKWPPLITIFVRVIESVLGLEWTVRITSSVSIDPGFVREWAEAMGSKPPVVTAASASSVEDVNMSGDGG